MTRPITCGSEPKARRQSPWPSTATAGPPGRSSSAENSRPRNGEIPRTRKKPADTRCCWTYSGRSPAARLTPLASPDSAAQSSPPACRLTASPIRPSCPVSTSSPSFPRYRSTRWVSRSGCGYGSGRSSAASTTLKIAVLASTHRPRVSTAASAKAGDLASSRTARRRLRAISSPQLRIMRTTLLPNGIFIRFGEPFRFRLPQALVRGLPRRQGASKGKGFLRRGGELELAADLAAREGGGVDVDVDHADADPPQDGVQVARGHALGEGAADHVAGVDRAADRAAPRRAGLGAGGPVAQVRAEEDHDAAVHSLLREVKVGLEDSRTQIEVAQLIGDLRAVRADGGGEMSASARGQRGHLVEWTQAGRQRPTLRMDGHGGERQHQNGRQKNHDSRSAHLAPPDGWKS